MSAPVTLAGLVAHAERYGTDGVYETADGRADRRYCTDACRQAAYRSRQTDRKPPTRRESSAGTNA